MPKTTTKTKSTKPATKQQQVVIDALRRPGGVTIKELMELTGWQQHTIRAVLSGLNHGRSGKRTIEQVPIERVKDGDRTVYRAVKAA